METNLYSNRFYGWGGEDDDLFHRLVDSVYYYDSTPIYHVQ